MPESILSPSLIKLCGRPITEIQLSCPQVALVRRPESRRKPILKEQLKAAKPHARLELFRGALLRSSEAGDHAGPRGWRRLTAPPDR